MSAEVAISGEACARAVGSCLLFNVIFVHRLDAGMRLTEWNAGRQFCKGLGWTRCHQSVTTGFKAAIGTRAF